MDPFSKEAYDQCYSIQGGRYSLHYKDLNYYPAWKCVAEKIFETDRVLDLGCGPGHLAHMLYDKGVRTLTGIDFSKVGIKMAKEKVPSFTFIKADVNHINYSKYIDYKVVSTETFEHLEDDIALIKKLPHNYMIFSVPNYLCIDHHRAYDSKEDIIKYYKDVLNVINIETFSMGYGDNQLESIIYVVEAKIK